ncbi:hypothetical protein TRVA0_040S01134 [Trichomonascus vanleenenianus]|uniref:uncharacterized protein n=1 Tax=Trichomonascus vanleenenianus TaxID=2268995 RepID=UPI003ECBAC27
MYGEGEKEDLVDLQIKSLMYVFRRCDIPNASPFSYPQGSSENDLFSPNKLDLMYNRFRFEQVVNADEHRILVDWKKNKFRSMCILSTVPREMTNLPGFDRHYNYRFIVLEPGESNDSYIAKLIKSDIYTEHHVDLKVRKEIARRAVMSETRPFDKNTRSRVIKRYLCQMAVHVQVERLFRVLATSHNRLINSIPEEEQPRVEEPEIVSSPESSPQRQVRKFHSFSALKTINGDKAPISPKITLRKKPSHQQLSPVKLPPASGLSSPPASPTKDLTNSPVRQSMGSSVGTSLMAPSKIPQRTLKHKKSLSTLLLNSMPKAPAANPLDLKKQAQNAVFARLNQERLAIRQQ